MFIFRLEPPSSKGFLACHDNLENKRPAWVPTSPSPLQNGWQEALSRPGLRLCSMLFLLYVGPHPLAAQVPGRALCILVVNICGSTFHNCIWSFKLNWSSKDFFLFSPRCCWKFWLRLDLILSTNYSRSCSLLRSVDIIIVDITVTTEIIVSVHFVWGSERETLWCVSELELTHTRS